MANTSTPAQRLDSIYQKYEVLRQDSPDSDFETFASLFAEDCTVHLRSMRERKEPARNRKEIVEQLHEILKDHFFKKRQIATQFVDEENSRVYSEMENDYSVHGTVFKNFPETCIATFTKDGLVSSFKLYSCRSDLVFLIQKATGEGPYSDEYLEQYDLTGAPSWFFNKTLINYFAVKPLTAAEKRRLVGNMA